MSKQTLAVLPQLFTIHSLEPELGIPAAVTSSPLYFIGKTAEELSIVVDANVDIDSTDKDTDWRALELVGPLALSMVGIMAQIGDVLASAKVSIFVISTFETDFFLVKQNKLDIAVQALTDANYLVIDGQ